MGDDTAPSAATGGARPPVDEAGTALGKFRDKKNRRIDVEREAALQIWQSWHYSQSHSDWSNRKGLPKLQAVGAKVLNLMYTMLSR